MTCVIGTKVELDNPNPTPWHVYGGPFFATFDDALAWAETEQAKEHGEGELDPDEPWIVIDIPFLLLQRSLLIDALDSLANERGEIQGDPATVADEVIGYMTRQQEPQTKGELP